MQCTDRNGNLAGAVQVFEGDDVMLISDQGTMVRTRTSEISVLGRNTQGVMLIRVAGDENLVSLARIEEPEVPDEDDLDGEEVVLDAEGNAVEGSVVEGTEEVAAEDTAIPSDDEDDVEPDAE
jgi:DNA gyrase subunit A